SALDARTGKPIWVDTKLLQTGRGTFGIQPEVVTGRVHLGVEKIGLGAGGVVNLAARTGKLMWKTSVGKHSDHDSPLAVFGCHGTVAGRRLPRRPAPTPPS
ncbi:MAG: hypothetical protein ACRDXC_04890, partial [Acidimicrobiales bacterium]